MHAVLQVHEATISAGAYPSPLNYFHFPKSVCTSVNEVCAQPKIHQLWSKAQLKIEDILCKQHTLCCFARCLTIASVSMWILPCRFLQCHYMPAAAYNTSVHYFMARFAMP